MEVQFTENKLIRLFIDIDDLYKSYLLFLKSKGGHQKQPTRQTQLHPSEICTILVSYNYSGYKCFEYYYKESILKRYKDYFPESPSYECFLSYLPKVSDLIYLWLFHRVSLSKKTGLYIVDSKKLEVCHIKREHSNRVFQGIAKKGKSSTGWFYGLKIHLVINNLGEIISFELTTGNVADNNQDLLKRLFKKLDGICVGDKGYLSKLFSFFFENGLHLITKPKRNMKKLPIQNSYNILINKRAVVESVFDILKSVCDIEHSRHRKPINAAVHIFSALIAYQYMDKKPRIFCPSISNKLKMAA